MKKCLFVLPRFHTNIAVGINKLIQDGWVVQVYVALSIPETEDYSHVKPIIIKDVDTLLRSVSDFSPDISFIRYVENASHYVMKYLLSVKSRVFAYCQFPASLNPSNSLLERYTSGFVDVPRYSPVRGPSHELSKNSIYFPLPIKISRYSPPSRKEDPKSIICVGKLNHSRKNHLALINFLNSMHPPLNYTITLVGNNASHNSKGSKEYYSQIKSISSDSENIRIMEDVPHREMTSIYSMHDYCILPSFNELLGSSPLESMGTGCIPFISRECGSSYEISHKKNGFLFDPHTFSGISSILTSLSSNDYYLTRFSINSYEYAKKYLNPSTFVSNVSKLLE